MVNKNTRLQEEINRVKQLGGYNVSLTLNEQSTGSNNFACMGGIIPGPGTCQGPGNYTMGNANVQAVFSTMADCQNSGCGGTTGGGTTGCMTVSTENCPNTTPGFGPGLLGNCATINGQPVTQADVGNVVLQVSPGQPAGWANVKQVIVSVQPQTQSMGNTVVDFTNSSCPTTTGTATGTTGGGIPICMKMTMQGCPGTSNANYTTNSSITKCATIDNIPVTASDVGRTIMQPTGGMIVVQSVTTNVNGNGSMNYYSAPGPCPKPNISTGTTTGTTGGFNPQKWSQKFTKIIKRFIKNKNPKGAMRFLKGRVQLWNKKLKKAKGKVFRKQLLYKIKFAKKISKKVK